MGNDTVLFKLGGCLAGSFLSACHFLPLSPPPTLSVPLLLWPALTVDCLPREAFTVPYHGNQPWHPDSVQRLCTIQLVLTENYIWYIKWHLQSIIIPFGMFWACLFSGNLPLARPFSVYSNIPMKSLTRWFYVNGNEPIATSLFFLV